jgi:hypothetical protein
MDEESIASIFTKYSIPVPTQMIKDNKKTLKISHDNIISDSKLLSDMLNKYSINTETPNNNKRDDMDQVSCSKIKKPSDNIKESNAIVNNNISKNIIVKNEISEVQEISAAVNDVSNNIENVHDIINNMDHVHNMINNVKDISIDHICGGVSSNDIISIKKDIENIYYLYNENIKQRKELFNMMNIKIHDLHLDIRKLNKNYSKLKQITHDHFN